ncbi:type II toxin-antitoxin system RelE family toxin [Belliella pelovolcani]|uniref:type II toxin-antitoxin system RelE family toxin n=1 Tax=Belliella pelovolcani TaxID=529505 RepID=UPI00391A89B1
MMYKVRLERKAQKKLAKIPDPYYSNIKASILDLGNNPRPKGYNKLRGREGYRIRVADYRIIYEIQDAILLVDVIDLGHR